MNIRLKISQNKLFYKYHNCIYLVTGNRTDQLPNLKAIRFTTI